MTDTDTADVSPSPIRVVVWNENVHERENATVRKIYPNGIHGCLAAMLDEEVDISASTATLQEPDHGLSSARLAETDVLIWWGHAAHGDVDDALVEEIVERVWAGMGMIFLHSSHFAKPFKRLMGSPCNLTWREAGERERLWVTAPGHPIVQGLSSHFELEHEEMYGEPFAVPEPLETVLISWFQGGEVFRSGLTYRRGAGKVFYFRPGHETYPTYHDANVRRVIRNAVRWSHDPSPHRVDVSRAPNRPVESALEKIEARGPKLHEDGEEGFR